MNNGFAESKQPFFEEVLERAGDTVIRSNIREATQEEITKANELHQQGNCPHNIVYDELGWPYDVRICYTCGKNLGLV